MSHAARVRQTKSGDSIRLDLIETGWRAASLSKAAVRAILGPFVTIRPWFLLSKTR